MHLSEAEIPQISSLFLQLEYKEILNGLLTSGEDEYLTDAQLIAPHQVLHVPNV